MLKQRMLKTYGDDLVKDVDIDALDQSTETTNEFLSTIRQRDTPETHYDKFGLSRFRGLETPLEETVIESIKEKLTHVHEFKVAWMNNLPTDVRCQFVDFAADVIE